MQPIDVRPQTSLSLARILGLCLKGIRHRLFRSVLTTMVVVLAVAFFMNLLADSVVARSVDDGVRRELAEQRRLAVAVDLWFGRPAPLVLAGRLARADAPLADYARIAGWEPARIDALAAACARERAVTGWLDALDGGTRAMLVRRVPDEEVLAWLGEGRRWDEFAPLAAKVRSVRLPVPLSEVKAAVDAAAATRASLAALASDWQARIDAFEDGLRRAGAGADRAAWLAWLADAAPGRAETFHAQLAAAGFGGLYDAAAVAAVQGDLRRERLRDEIAAALSSEAGRKAWLTAYRSQAPLEEKMLRLAEDRAGAVLDGRFSPEERAEVAAQVASGRALAACERALAGTVDPAGGLVSTRQLLLVAISFLVCMVGIANAMLMAITERFREIATMKCLGATDGFILTQFLMEAGIQGAAGGALGMVLGMAITLAKGGLLYGGYMLWYLPVLGLLGAGAACIVAGLLLATLASIYPSWLASRMAPMEAMRVE